MCLACLGMINNGLFAQETSPRKVFTLDEGKAKLVQIDEDGNVSMVVECTPDSEVNELTTYSIQLKEGKNRLKFVGYDCKNVTFYMEIKES